MNTRVFNPKGFKGQTEIKDLTRLVVNRDKPVNYGQGMTTGPIRIFKSVIDNILLELGGLPHVLPFAVH